MQNTLNNAFVYIRLGTVSCAGHADSLGDLLINCDGLFYGRTESVSSKSNRQQFDFFVLKTLNWY